MAGKDGVRNDTMSKGLGRSSLHLSAPYTASRSLALSKIGLG
jgi:hypothetical protein